MGCCATKFNNIVIDKQTKDNTASSVDITKSDNDKKQPPKLKQTEWKGSEVEPKQEPQKTIEMTDEENKAGIDDDPFVTRFYNNSGYSLKISDGSAVNEQKLSPPEGTIINSGSQYAYCLFDYININIYDEADAKGDYLGTASVSVQGSGQNRYLFDKTNTLLFTYNAGNSSYDGSDHFKWWRAEDITAPNIVAGPPVITNDGWRNGMSNQQSEATANTSFWVQDYGMNEDGRWNVQNGALYQSTKDIKSNDNYGSRAYPIYLSTGSPTWNIENTAPGIAFDGCWQIHMKCGSNGTDQPVNFCETFYLAERANLNPGPVNYQDGSGQATGGNSREIDIMETQWKPDGPQANCPNADNTGWNINTQWSNGVQMGKWSDIIGGLPMKEFVIFGCLIRDKKLWIYGYKNNGIQWFCSEAIENNNLDYNQKNPFVPYIGTWTTQKTAGDFETGYNNFVYLKQNDPKIDGKNPKDNPESFGGNLD